MAPLILALLLVQSPAPAPRLEDGIRLVEQGDFETAVVTLRESTTAIAGDPKRSVERARGYLYLGVAHLALDQTPEAHRAFVSALRDDPGLRVTEDTFSPKVVAAFEAARREQPAAKTGGGSGKKVVVAALAGAAVATGAVIALGGSEAGVRVLNARFAATFIDCPDNSNALPIAYTVLADVRNDGDTAAVIAGSITARIEVSSEAEVGQTSSRPVSFAPMSLPGHATTTLRLDSTLLCSNDAGGPSRANEWRAHLIITTSAGTIAGETADPLLRVNIP